MGKPSLFYNVCIESVTQISLVLQSGGENISFSFEYPPLCCVCISQIDFHEEFSRLSYITLTLNASAVREMRNHTKKTL